MTAPLIPPEPDMDLQADGLGGMGLLTEALLMFLVGLIVGIGALALVAGVH